VALSYMDLDELKQWNQLRREKDYMLIVDLIRGD
jgi:hypothetical protein